MRISTGAPARESGKRQKVPRSRAPALPHSRTPRCGAAAVELAIVLPALVLIVIGCVDLGRFLYYHIAVTNAAEEGATYGSLHPPSWYPTSSAWESKVITVATEEAKDLRMNGAAAPLLPGNVTVTQSNGRVQVEVTHTFQTILNYPWLPSSFPVKRSVVMPFTR